MYHKLQQTIKVIIIIIPVINFETVGYSAQGRVVYIFIRCIIQEIDQARCCNETMVIKVKLQSYIARKLISKIITFQQVRLCLRFQSFNWVFHLCIGLFQLSKIGQYITIKKYRWINNWKVSTCIFIINNIFLFYRGD